MTLKFTGERVVTNEMQKMPAVLQDHIARYNFTLDYLVGKTVLDAACGNGYGVDLMAQMAAKVEGCDIDEETIRSNTESYPHRFFVADLNDMQSTESYDVITSFETIEHIENPEAFLKWASEHCKMFIFSIPVNQPSEFHKHEWSIPQIVEMIEKYFPQTFFFSQVRMNFYRLSGDATYVVGVGENGKT